MKRGKTGILYVVEERANRDTVEERANRNTVEERADGDTVEERANRDTVCSQRWSMVEVKMQGFPVRVEERNVG